jgi:hypothetical protein
MKKAVLLFGIAGTAAMAAAPPSVRNSDACAAALKAMPAITECQETANGVVVGTHAGAVKAAARGASEGERRFRAYFDRPVPRYAVAFNADFIASNALRQAGFKVVKPWLDTESKAAAIDQSVRRAVLKAVEGKNMTPEQIDAMVAQAKSKVPQASAAKVEDTDAGALAHELGHQWFMAAFWPGQNVGKSGHYAGPAPDWLDELAAVLHESDQMAADRRRQFRMVYLQEPNRKMLPDVRLDGLMDLVTYLTREHPLNRAARDFRDKMKQESGQTSGVLLMTGVEAQGAAQSSLMFYLQSRIFADFLLERTGNQRLFSDIAAADARGLNFRGWLAKNGSKNKLPASFPELQKLWQTWVKASYGKPSE